MNGSLANHVSNAAFEGARKVKSRAVSNKAVRFLDDVIIELRVFNDLISLIVASSGFETERETKEIAVRRENVSFMLNTCAEPVHVKETMS